MRLFNGINRYLAFKTKELEFRLRTWQRSREISRAYSKRPVWKIPFNINFTAFTPYLVKGAKVFAVVAVMVLAAYGAIRVIPLLPPPGDAAGRAQGASDDTVMIDDGALLEAAVLPEGYEESLTADAQADTQAGTQVDADLYAELGESAYQTPPAGGVVAQAFRAGMPDGISSRLVLVDKAAKMMYILGYEESSGWEILRAYPVATGERDGRKMVEGDKKTPHGVYFMVGRKHRSELTDIYGPAAFITDYPNEDDRQAGRTGHGIWIHGSERGSIPPLFTSGCVAASNPDIIDFARVIGNDWAGVPIIILSGEEDAGRHLASVDFNALRARREKVIAEYSERQAMFELLIANWGKAWESRDIGKYSEFYMTSSFREGRATWEEFRERKYRLFNTYSEIHVGLSGITLTEYTANLATVKFRQVYNTNMNNRIENAKRLIFRKDQDNNWKIYREIPFPQEELIL